MHRPRQNPVDGRPAARPGREARRDGIKTIASLVAVSAAAGTAGFAFHRVFGHRPLLEPVCLAAVTPVLLAAVLALRRVRIPLPLSQALSAGVWLLLATAVLLPRPTSSGRPVASAPSTIGNWIVNGWAQLLNITLPAPARPELLVVPFALTWLAASLGAELVLRTGAVLAPVVPALVAFTAALAFSVPGTGSNMPHAVVFSLSASALILLRAARRAPGLSGSPRVVHERRPDAGTRLVHRRGDRRVRPSAVVAIPLMLGVTAAATAAAPHGVFHRSAVDPRQYWPVPIRQVPEENPLDRVAGWLARPDQNLFEVRSAVGANWRIAVLDRFDGRRWTSSARFTPAGSGVPWPARTRHGRFVRGDFRVAELGGTLLPAADRPVRVQGPPLSVDTDSGMLLGVQALTPGTRYSVTSELIPDLRPEQLAGLRAAAQPDADPALRLPAGLATELSALVDDAMTSGAAASDFQRAALLERHLRRTFRNNPKGPAGYADGDLERFIATREGTCVQFAETFTLAARSMRLPSRMVVGFSQGSLAADRRTYRIRAGNTLVWSEIAFAGVGWIPFFPTPQPVPRPRQVWDGPAQGETSAQAQDRSRALEIPPRQSTRPSTRAASPSPLPGSVRRAPERDHTGLLRWVLGAVATACLGYLVAVLLMPSLLRLRRRTRGTADERIVGAWHDLLDQLADMGKVPPPGATNSDVARAAVQASGWASALAVTSLADLATHAMFAPSASTEAHVYSAWRYRDETRAVLRLATPFRQRVRARLMVVRVRRRHRENARRRTRVRRR